MILSELSKTGVLIPDIRVYTLNPCREYWFDVVDQKRLSYLVARKQDGHHEVGNALLAAWGKQTQGHIDLLFANEGSITEEDSIFLPASGEHLLARVQNAILDLVELAPGGIELASDDRSIEVHVCHSLTRELEVLHDQLLAQFAAGDPPTPSQIVVLLPDLPAAAPLINAVFGTAPAPRRIPYTITGLPQTRVNPIARVLDSLLALCGSRFAASVVFDLLQQPLVDENAFPQVIDLLKTRSEPIGVKLEVGNVAKLDITNPDLFAVYLQNPDNNGEIKDHSAFIASAHEKEVFVVMGADLMSLLLMKSPGEMGADVVVGNSQRFGVPMGFGGPHAAFFATKEEFKRQIPGRIIGVSIDAQGNPAFRMALQTREQHFRREKATSNICPAQVLLSVMASMYAVYHSENHDDVSRFPQEARLPDGAKAGRAHLWTGRQATSPDAGRAGASALHTRRAQPGDRRHDLPSRRCRRSDRRRGCSRSRSSCWPLRPWSSAADDWARDISSSPATRGSICRPRSPLQQAGCRWCAG